MASILKVNEIQHTGGTSAMTVNSDGDIDIANFICQGFVLTSSAVGDQNPITGWGRYETTLSVMVLDTLTMVGILQILVVFFHTQPQDFIK